MRSDNGFVVKYTNKDIMDKLEKIEEKIELTNRRSQKAVVIAGVCLSLSLATIAFLIEHIIKG